MKKEIKYNGHVVGTIDAKKLDYGSISSVSKVEGNRDMYAVGIIIGKLRKIVYLLSVCKPNNLVIWGHLQNPNPERYQDFGTKVYLTEKELKLKYTDSVTLNNVESVYPLFK